jgi:hypothetical protein
MAKNVKPLKSCHRHRLQKLHLPQKFLFSESRAGRSSFFLFLTRFFCKRGVTS